MVPCVCGMISLSGNKLPPDVNPQAKLIFSDQIGSAVIYQLGSAFNIHSYPCEKGIIIITGSVYSSSDFNDSNEISRLTSEVVWRQELKDFEGNFVLISYQVSADGSPIISIATDRFGTRLALYFQENGTLYFATHLSGIRFLLKNRLPPLSEDSLIHYYHFGFTANDRTLFAGINKIPPGSQLLVSGANVSLKKYQTLWDFYDSGKYAGQNENEIAEMINNYMATAITRRNPLKLPIAVTLSGGVDSGYIAKKSRQLGIDVFGYNLAYESEYNEFSRIDKLQKDLNLKLNKKIATPEMLFESVEAANRVSSEPVKFNDAAMRLLAIEAKKDGFDSVWDGDGADRLFFGMNRQMQYFKLFGHYKLLNKFYVLPLLLFLAGKLKNNEFQKLNILLRNWRNGIPPYPERKFGKIKQYDKDLEKMIFELGAEKYWKEYNNKQSVEDLILYFTYQSIQMCPEMFFHPPAEQQAALELSAVSPYWDSQLVSLALSIPSFLKIKKSQTKYIIRKAASSSGDHRYWLSKKIGLQDAFKFSLKSAIGKAWREAGISKIIKSNEFQILQSILPNTRIDPEALLTFNLWKQVNVI